VVVVDTNVVVAGLITRDPAAPTARILVAMLDGSLRFAVSLPLLAEYQRVLRRPAIAALHRLGPGEVEDLVAEIAASAVVVDPLVAGTTAPDPGDQHLLDLLATRPDLPLITGDQLLLERLPNDRVTTPAHSWLSSR
jgi:putative PIN family toxin of toxin-antitoxin system